MTDLLGAVLVRLRTGWARVRAGSPMAGADGVTVQAFSLQLDLELSRLRAEVAAGDYQPQPLFTFDIPKPAGGTRTLAIPAVRDRVLQGAALDVLGPRIEAELEDTSFAYRPGRSHRSALDRVRTLRDEGFRYVAEADVDAFFDSVDHDLLLDRLAGVAPAPDLLDLVRLWLTADAVDAQGRRTPRTRGLPQGAAISPALANLFLDDLDEALARDGHCLVRFADDFVVLARTRERAEDALDLSESVLAELALRLKPSKTGVVHFDEGFRFLGSLFVRGLDLPSSGPPGPASATPPPLPAPPRASLEQTAIGRALLTALDAEGVPLESFVADLDPAPPLAPEPADLPPELPTEPPETPRLSPGTEVFRRTLYVQENGAWLRVRQDRFLVTARQDPATDRLSVTVRDVDQVVLLGAVHATPAALRRCLREAIPLHWLSSQGRLYGHAQPAGATDTRRLRTQVLRSLDPAFRLDVARRIIRAKLANSRTLLSRYARRTGHRQLADAASALAGLMERLDAAADLNVVRGLEGQGAALTFGVFGLLLHGSPFTFERRTRRPPTDPVNAFLSFGYTLLHQTVHALLVVHGLHPGFGTLHEERPGHPALASDLVEEFRVLVDQTVLAACNRGTLRPEHVEPAQAGGAGIYLTADGRKRFIGAFERTMRQPVAHPAAARPVSYRRCIDLQVRAYVATLDGAPYVPFTRSA